MTGNQKKAVAVAALLAGGLALLHFRGRTYCASVTKFSDGYNFTTPIFCGLASSLDEWTRKVSQAADGIPTVISQLFDSGSKEFECLGEEDCKKWGGWSDAPDQGPEGESPTDATE